VAECNPNYVFNRGEGGVLACDIRISDLRFEISEGEERDGREISGGGVQGEYQSADDFADEVCTIWSCGRAFGKHRANNVGKLFSRREFTLHIRR
jgi:hypothetical protein